MKDYSAFPKTPVLQEPHYQIVECHKQDTRWGESNSPAEKQLVYSTAPADWAKFLKSFWDMVIWYQVIQIICCSIWPKVGTLIGMAQLAGAAEYTDCISAEG